MLDFFGHELRVRICRYFALEVMVGDLTDFDESSGVIVSSYWTLYNINIDNDLNGGDRGGWLGGL